MMRLPFPLLRRLPVPETFSTLPLANVVLPTPAANQPSMLLAVVSTPVKVLLPMLTSALPRLEVIPRPAKSMLRLIVMPDGVVPARTPPWITSVPPTRPMPVPAALIMTGAVPPPSAPWLETISVPLLITVWPVQEFAAFVSASVPPSSTSDPVPLTTPPSVEYVPPFVKLLKLLEPPSPPIVSVAPPFSATLPAPVTEATVVLKPFTSNVAPAATATAEPRPNGPLTGTAVEVRLLPVVPMANTEAAPDFSVPPLIVVAPVYVLFPDKITAPVPSCR